MIWADSTPVLRENTMGSGLEPPVSVPFPPTLREDLRKVFRVFHAAYGLGIYKHPCLLQDSNLSLTVQQSASQLL
ncbi:hypothetical protein TNCV_3038061 [Trichonephila clavipes]|nr:hypothetical protein TNCV_3038061 [Trichonephila clavipes]